jgi:hypothetical protein
MKEYDYSLTYVEAKDYFIHRFTGAINIDTIFSAMSQLRQHASFYDTVPVLWDIREVDTEKLTQEVMWQFELQVRQKVPSSKRNARIAYLVATELQFAVARQFITLAGWSDNEYIVTRSMDEANTWLRPD